MDILSICTDLGSSFGIISGPMNRVFDIKSGTIFVGIETLSRLFIFRSMFIPDKVPWMLIKMAR